MVGAGTSGSSDPGARAASADALAIHRKAEVWSLLGRLRADLHEDGASTRTAPQCAARRASRFVAANTSVNAADSGADYAETAA